MTKEKEKQVELLEEIKNLMILQLAKSGVKSQEVAKALDCGASTLRKKFRFKKEKNVRK